MRDFVIRNIKTLLNGKGKSLSDVDIYVSDGKIQSIDKGVDAKGIQEFDGKGKVLLPGFVDLHTHFCEPGFEAKETIATGAQAAIRGGYVAAVSMPNTNPPSDQQSVIDNILRKAREVPFKLLPCGAMSKNREGQELSEMADLKRSGIVCVSDAPSWLTDSLLMRRAMEYASMLDLPVIVFPEDSRLSANGVMNEGLESTQLGLPGSPLESESIAVARDIELARLTGASVHFAFISTARSVELVRRAKEDGIGITAAVTPYNLLLDDSSLEGYNTNFKLYPPLRSKGDVKALQQALKDGIVDCISTNHVPCTDEEKMAEFDQAPFGSIGLETAFSVVLNELYHCGGWKLEEILQIFHSKPKSILNLEEDFGIIDQGQLANFTLVDLDREWTVEKSLFRSQSNNSCFLNQAVKGAILATACAGELHYFENKNGEGKA